MVNRGSFCSRQEMTEFLEQEKRYIDSFCHRQRLVLIIVCTAVVHIPRRDSVGLPSVTLKVGHEVVRKVTRKLWLILIFASTSLLNIPQLIRLVCQYNGPSAMRNLHIAEGWSVNMNHFGLLMKDPRLDVKQHRGRSSDTRIGSREEPS